MSPVNELIKRLMRMFPRHADEIEAWSPSYVRRLGRFSRDDLEAAVSEVLDGWTHGYPPKPEQFRAAAPEQFRGKSKLRIERGQWAGVYAERDRLMAEWVRFHEARFGELDIFAQWHVRRMVLDEAFLEAQSAAAQQRQTEPVDISEEAWALALARAASQRPIEKDRGEGEWKPLVTPAKALAYDLARKAAGAPAGPENGPV